MENPERIIIHCYYNCLGDMLFYKKVLFCACQISRDVIFYIPDNMHPVGLEVLEELKKELKISVVFYRAFRGKFAILSKISFWLKLFLKAFEKKTLSVIGVNARRPSKIYPYMFIPGEKSLILYANGSVSEKIKQYPLSSNIKIYNYDPYMYRVENMALGLPNTEKIGKHYLPQPTGIKHKHIVLAPGNGNMYPPLSFRCYPHYIELAKKLLEYLPKNENIIFIGGGKSDENCFQNLRECCRGEERIEFLFNTPYAQYRNVIAEARCMISNDNGLAHLADLHLGTPVLMLIGPTRPEEIAPQGKNSAYLRAEYSCLDCFDRKAESEYDLCLKRIVRPCLNIPPEKVIEKLLALKLLP